MSQRIEMIRSVYESYDEDRRLVKSQHGRLEYLTTMHYIHRYAGENAKIIEIGAGTGRYSVALAKEGHDVTAVELVQHNIEILREHGKGLDNLKSFRGDALDLEAFGDNTFDVTLVFGPMYHLYSSDDQHKAIDEAIRITRPGGIVMFAFLSVYAIILSNYLYGDLRGGLLHNFDIDRDPDRRYIVKHTEDQIFTGFDIAEFEGLFAHKPVSQLHLVAADSSLEFGELLTSRELEESSFAAYADYHLATCEIRELLGNSGHLLYICRKESEQNEEVSL